MYYRHHKVHIRYSLKLYFSCQMNCRTPASSREKLGLVAKCDDCAVSSNYSYTWHVDTNISWVEDTGTGRNARTFTVNANVLPVNQTFNFSVTGTVVNERACVMFSTTEKG